MSILGVVLIILGVAFIGLGFAGAVKEMFGRKPGAPETVSIPDVTGLIKAITELIKGLTAAPMWLALTAIGFALVIYGAYIH